MSMSTDTRLAEAFENAPVLPLTPYTRYVLFSDCHRGTGTSGDNFLKNQHLYFAALRHYYDKGCTYIELGDGDELWENRSIKMIQAVHSNTFWLLSRFYQENRLYMLYGNHDMVKKYPRFAEKNCSCYLCSTEETDALFPGITFHSGIILKPSGVLWKESAVPKDIYLTHGHQADFLNSVLWKTARFLVRYIWKPLEQTGVHDPTSAARNYNRKRKIESRLSDWAQKNDCILITGHTHRPRLDASDSYCNTGSCVHPRCITCIEFDGPYATLVKWTMTTKADQTLYVSREILAGPLIPGG